MAAVSVIIFLTETFGSRLCSYCIPNGLIHALSIPDSETKAYSILSWISSLSLKSVYLSSSYFPSLEVNFNKGVNRLIQSRFNSIPMQNRFYNASVLNSSLSSIEQSINGSQAEPGYIFATLLAGNSTASPITNSSGGDGSGDGSGSPAPHHGKNELAM